MISQWVDTVCAQTPQSSGFLPSADGPVHIGEGIQRSGHFYIYSSICFLLGCVCVFSKCLCTAYSQPGLCELVCLSFALCCQCVENSARNKFVPIVLGTSGHSAYSRWRSRFHRKHLWVWVACYPKPLSTMAVQLLTPIACPTLAGPLQQGSNRGEMHPFSKKITDSHSANSKFSSFSKTSAC